MAVKKYENVYKKVKKSEYGKRLINLNEDIKFNRKKIKKLHRKHKKKNRNMILARCLLRENFKFLLICHHKFGIDRRLNVLNFVKELNKYRTDNIYFKSYYADVKLMKFYTKESVKDSKYKSQDNLLDFVVDELLIKG